MDDEGVVYYEGLNSIYGIKVSRTQLARWEKAKRFPLRIKPHKIRGARFFYLRRDIVAWIRGTWA